MSNIAPPAPPVDTSNPAPAAEPEYDFGTALSETLALHGNDPSKAFRGEPAPSNTPAPAPQAPPAPAPKAPDPAPPKPEPKAPEEPKDDEDAENAGLLENLLKGGDLKEPPPSRKPGDAPTDPTSREFTTWKELRGAYDVTAKELADFKKRLADTESKIPKDYDQLKEEITKRDTLLKEKDAHIAKIDLFKNDRYQREIAVPISTIEQQFDKMASDYKVSKALLREAVTLTDDREREEAINHVLGTAESTIPITTMARAVMGATNLHELLDLQKQYMDNAPKMLEMIQEQENAEKSKLTEREKEEFGRSANVALQIIERTLPFLKDKDGKVDPEAIKQIRADADKDFNSLKPGQKAFALMSPAIVERAVKAFKEFGNERKAFTDEIAKLKLQLSKYVSASPNTTPGGGNLPAGGGSPDPDKDPFADYSSAQLSQLPVL